ncbi:MAG: hypothetical protein L0206_23980, partial [Actinobacteria bacterium]|nr:hypothetical protein [Actinomycetota bacterium]
PTAATLDDGAVSLGFPGGFPSDLVVDGNGRLFTVPDALIPATVVAYDTTTAPPAPLFNVPIVAANLIDFDGVTPARAPTSFGSGLFGAFTGDIEVVSDRWVLVTVGAGNSVSVDANGTLRLANLVLIDATAGTVVQTLNLAWSLAAPGHTNTGSAYTTVPQSLPSMVTFVPATDGTPTGRVYVAMSNGAGTNAGLQEFFHGTVQSWHADFRLPQPLSPETAGKAAGDVTRTYVSAYFNPVGFTRHGRHLILTNAGASRFNASFVAEPTTDAVLEFLDVDADVWRDNWTVDLGEILPSIGALAIGEDEGGMRFGALTSQTFSAAWFVDLSGLDESPVDPLKLRLLRAVDLSPGGSTTIGSGYQPGIGLSPGGKTLFISAFNGATLHALSLPDDIELGLILVDEEPFDALGPARSSLGVLAAPAGAAADVYVVVNGTFDPNFLPLGSSFVGTLTVDGDLP